MARRLRLAGGLALATRLISRRSSLRSSLAIDRESDSPRPFFGRPSFDLGYNDWPDGLPSFRRGDVDLGFDFKIELDSRFDDPVRARAPLAMANPRPPACLILFAFSREG